MKKVMYPLKFRPVYKECIWGGTNLKKVFGRDICGEHVGESWELSGHDNGMSIVSNGEFAGKNLKELLAGRGEAVLGKGFAEEKSFPLLIKIIDAQDDLSIQVHPNDENALISQGEAGKNEAWYVVSAREEARIVYGLNPGMSKEKFIEAVQCNKVCDAVRTVRVKAGDMIFVPAGTVHALLDGVMVYEIQQSSDTTYRIYDYDRRDKAGKLRELHIDKALKVINFAAQESDDFSGEKISCPHFSVERMIVSGEKKGRTADAFIVYCIVDGCGEIRYQDKVETLKSGETVLIPACLGEFVIAGDLTMLRIEK